MAWTLIAHTKVAGLGGTPITTPAIDTTGADLLVIGISQESNGPTSIAAISDSKGNTWTSGTVHAVLNGVQTVIEWVPTPTVGTGHTFTLTKVDNNFAGALEVQAWSGSATSPFGGQNGATVSGATSLATGSVSPGVAGSLIVAVLGSNNVSSIAIDTGFTISDTNAFAGGSNYAGSLAYLAPDTAPVNPTWTWTSSAASSASIVVFKPPGGGGSATPFLVNWP